VYFDVSVGNGLGAVTRICQERRGETSYGSRGGGEVEEETKRGAGGRLAGARGDGRKK